MDPHKKRQINQIFITKGNDDTNMGLVIEFLQLKKPVQSSSYPFLYIQ